jgi:hypothetical protein
MAIQWSKQTFRKWYSFPHPFASTVTTYSRVGWRYFRGPNPEWGYANTQAAQWPDHPINEYRHRVERLVAQFPIQPNSRIITLGCGNGFLPEVFIWWKQQQGLSLVEAQSQVAGVENSQWIQGQMMAEAHPVMTSPSMRCVNRSLLDGAGTPAMRNQLRNLCAGSEFFDFVVTESVIEPASFISPYSPGCRQDVFSETPIHPLGCLCVRIGAKGRLLAPGVISTSHLAHVWIDIHS